MDRIDLGLIVPSAQSICEVVFKQEMSCVGGWGRESEEASCGQRRLGGLALQQQREDTRGHRGIQEEQNHVGGELQASDEANLGTVPAWPPPAENGENIDNSTARAQPSPRPPPRSNDAPMTHPTGDAVRETNSWLEWHHPGGPSPKSSPISQAKPRPCQGQDLEAMSWKRTIGVEQDARVRQPSFSTGQGLTPVPI